MSSGSPAFDHDSAGTVPARPRRATVPKRSAGGRGWVGLVLILLGLAACGDGTGPRTAVRVPAGASFHQVTDSLARKEIVRAPTLFRIYARIRGADQEIQAGTYGFRRHTGWNRVLSDLRSGRVLTTRMAVPEGWTASRIASRMGRLTGTPIDSVRSLLDDTATAARMGVPGPTLEGYLYPATYTVPVDATALQIIRRMVRQYKEVWTPERRSRAEALELTEREVVTLASIIEAEAKHREEMPSISAVYHNRLRIGYPLQADPTVQYALGEHQSRLLYGHIESVADHPYNTYRRRGLPPGPIGSPSAHAIDAALWPADVDYLYFVARPDGSHVFTRSLREHNRAKARVRRERRSTTDGEP